MDEIAMDKNIQLTEQQIDSDPHWFKIKFMKNLPEYQKKEIRKMEATHQINQLYDRYEENDSESKETEYFKGKDLVRYIIKIKKVSTE